MGNWRNIVKQTYKNTAHIDRQTGEKMRKSENLTGLVAQGATLFDKYVSGKKDQAELDAFGASQGLEYDKKTKTYSGFNEGDDGEFSAYNVKSADLKNMQNLSKYTDDTFQDFITNKEGGIKSIYQDKERSASLTQHAAELKKLRNSVGQGIDDDDYFKDSGNEPDVVEPSHFTDASNRIRRDQSSIDTIAVPEISTIDTKDVKTSFSQKVKSMFSNTSSAAGVIGGKVKGAVGGVLKDLEKKVLDVESLNILPKSNKITNTGNINNYDEEEQRLVNKYYTDLKDLNKGSENTWEENMERNKQSINRYRGVTGSGDIYK